MKTNNIPNLLPVATGNLIYSRAMQTTGNKMAANPVCEQRLTSEDVEAAGIHANQRQGAGHYFDDQNGELVESISNDSIGW